MGTTGSSWFPVEPAPALIRGLPVKVFQMADRVKADNKKLQAKPLGNWHGHSTDGPRINEPLISKLDLSEMITALPSLTKKDLKTLQVAVDAELTKNIPIDTDLFYMVFDVASEKPMSVSKFSNSENGTIWRKNQPTFNNFVDSLLNHGMAYRVAFTKALKKFLLQLIVEDIKESHMPLTLRTICQQLGNVESIFNRAYPGYLRNQLQHLILAQLGSK